MPDPHRDPPPPEPADRRPAPPAPARGDAGQTQRDEAREEGAGRQSVPVEDLTTANDAGQG